MENTTVSGNTAYTGGGIDCRNNSILNLDVVKIVSNSASGYGGGIRCENSSPSLVNVTISGNFSGSNGGGIFFAGSDPVIINSILWNDYPQEIYFHSGSATATYSDIQGGWAGTGNIDSNPFFVDSSNGDYHLRSTSPCIDSGDPSSPLDPDSSRVDMGAYYFNQSIGAPAITAVTDVSNDQGRSVIVTWQRSIWDQALSITPIVGYNLWEKYPFELDRKSTVTNDINKAIEEQNTYFQREDTTWVLIANVFAMQWEEYSVNAVTYLDSTIAGDYLSYFFVSAHTPSPWIYFSSSVESGYSVDNIAPDETRVYIVQNGSNIALNWDEVEYGTFQGNSYLEINGIWYKIYAGDSPDFVCDEAHLIDTVTDLNYDYPLSGEERSSSRS
jgi:predicted outer membrane repeat protein